MEGNRSSGQNNNGEEQRINVSLSLVKRVGLAVKRSDTVRDLKELLNEKEGISENLQHLFFSGERLRDDQMLVDCGIQQNSALLCFVKNIVPLKLFVKLTNNQKVAVIARSCDTIKDVRSSILATERIHSDDFNLVYAGKLLENDKTLASLNIQGGVTLHMIRTPRDALIISVKMPTGRILKMKVKMLYTVADIKTLV
ncbi:OLC1v1019665C1 [Oldenlandia corymbosa var. corymbosa]|uniref:OLC1v1019665C1 n=1 Tax=Oldenlandia corymbosa var. corymbosa TaxID=529605 RepID=A0AAV1EEH5_OLDCO|nr:OLC1v1019665C1 [Oldenlandia corymbosa var. corymbosa]